MSLAPYLPISKTLPASQEAAQGPLSLRAHLPAVQEGAGENEGLDEGQA
jgi:hypothetical protein